MRGISGTTGFRHHSEGRTALRLSPSAQPSPGLKPSPTPKPKARTPAATRLSDMKLVGHRPHRGTFSPRSGLLLLCFLHLPLPHRPPAACPTSPARDRHDCEPWAAAGPRVRPAAAPWERWKCHCSALCSPESGEDQHSFLQTPDPVPTRDGSKTPTRALQRQQMRPETSHASQKQCKPSPSSYSGR